HGFVEVQLAVHLGHGLRGAGQFQHHVDTFGLLLDVVCHATTAPDVDLVDGALVLAYDVQDSLQARLHGPLAETWIEDDHHCIGTQLRPPPLDSCGHGLSVAGGLGVCAANHHAFPG